MRKGQNQNLYVSPQAEVIETQLQGVLCQSTTGTGLDDMPETGMDINY